MKRYGKNRADLLRFAVAEKPSAFLFLTGVYFALAFLVSGSSFLRGMVNANLEASLESFPANEAVAFALPENENEFFDAPLMQEAKEEGMEAEMIFTASIYAILPEKAAGHSHMVSFAPSAHELRTVYGIEAPETFDGVLLSSAFYDSLPEEERNGSIRFFSGETVFADVPICGVYSFSPVPNFLSPIQLHPIGEEHLFLPSSYQEAFQKEEAPLHWSKSAVLRFPAPLTHERSLLFSAAFSRYEISTKALVYETESGKLASTLFAYFDATDALLLIVSLLLGAEACFSFFSRKQKERAIRIFSGMGTPLSLLYGFFACFLPFVLANALCSLSQSVISLAFFPYLRGRVAQCFSLSSSWIYFAFLSFSCLAFLLISFFTHRSAFEGDRS